MRTKICIILFLIQLGITLQETVYDKSKVKLDLDGYISKKIGKSNETKQSNETKVSNESKESNQTKESNETKTSDQTKESNSTKGSNETKESYETKENENDSDSDDDDVIGGVFDVKDKLKKIKEQIKIDKITGLTDLAKKEKEAVVNSIKGKLEAAKKKFDIFNVVKNAGKGYLEYAILMTGASLTASILVVQVAVLPLVFKYSKAVQRKMVFSNCINYPRNLNYESPSSVNIVGGRNLSIEFQSKVDECPIKIGMWHIIPCSMFRQVFILRDSVALESELLQELKTTRKTVVLYCHGNSNHRASPHRLQMYKVFQELDFHVITFDYRGYGDSTFVRPTERGVVEDCLQVYSWLINSLDNANRPTVVLWGHSLGTAVASNMVAHLQQLCLEHGMPSLPLPDALVLEAPFNNLIDEIESHPFSKLVSWLPYYKDTFLKPFTASPEYAFTTDQYLARAPHLPTLMLHCKGDKIVPYQLAVKLYESVRKSRSSSSAPLVFHSFEKGLGLGHNNICEACDLQTIVRNFLLLAKKHK